MNYHVPVLLQTALDGLNIQSDGIYIDATFGGGGHSKSILKYLSAKGHLYGFDQDEDARQNEIVDDRFTFVRANFRYIRHFMNYFGHDNVDGVLADLGLSSHQVDTPRRGFSYRLSGPLDMRMNKQARLKAFNVLKDYEFEELVRVFSELGEIRNSKTLAKLLVERRQVVDIDSTTKLLEILEECSRGNPQKYHSQVFQALRMEVNDELYVLQEFLNESAELLKQKGRLVVISYHSGEDRVVKCRMKNKFYRTEGSDEKKFEAVLLRMLSKEIITPTSEEISKNPRARSAKLRIAEKL